MNSPNRSILGITLLEVMVVMVVLAVMGFFLLQRLGRSRMRAPSKRIQCVNNLKQVGLAYRIWAMDHGDKFPTSLASTNGGTMNHPLAAHAWIHLQILSNELASPKILVCPTDSQKTTARNFGLGFGRSNVSYFVGMDADEMRPNWLLSGDRNLTTNGAVLKPGVYGLNTNDVIGFSKGLHRGCGNVGLGDGSVQQMSSAALQQYLQINLQTNRLAIP